MSLLEEVSFAVTCRERQHAINVPLKDGMTDSAYEMLFKPIMRRILEVYQPEAIVFQSGQYPFTKAKAFTCMTSYQSIQVLGEIRSRILSVRIQKRMRFLWSCACDL